MSATTELFQAIADYPFFGASKDPEKAHAALTRMKAALSAGATWKALIGPGQRDAAFSAATCGDERPLALLIEFGVPVDHSLPNEGTLLHRAASFGRVAIIEFLLDRGIPVDVKSASGRTPLDRARAWKHGRAAVPLLTRLTKAAARTKPAEASTGDLTKKAIAEAMRTMKLAPSLKRLRVAIAATLAGRAAIESEQLLLELARQEDDDVLSAAIQLVRQASTAPPKRRTLRQLDDELVHHGDLTISRSVDARVLVVTGSLTVKGRLTNFEGCVIAVGGALRTGGLITEGPLVVGGDLTAKVIVAGTNDYAMTVGGTVTAEVVLIEDRHVARVKRWKTGTKVAGYERLAPAARRAVDALRR